MSIRPVHALVGSLALGTGGAALAGETVATYRMTFTAVWSPETHPLDFPPNPHFSGLIGGSHDARADFWEVGGLASPGIEAMAETGSKTLLEGEINDAIAAGTARAVISRGSLDPSPGERVWTFNVYSRHPRLTLTTMIAPTPDWFVGVDSLAMTENGVWKDEVVVSLRPYDAGTDSGVTYLSPNEDTDPQEPIRDLSDEYPFQGTGPLGTFTFTLVSVSGCAADFNDDGVVNTQDVLSFLNAWNAGDLSADITADGVVNTQDVLAFLNLWSAGCA